jgi:anaerobic selenocysteine-containing dehydrogenase
MELNRRRFLGFTAGAAAGTVVGVPVSKTLSDWVAATDEIVYPPRGVEDSVLSICQMCPGGCGLRVRRIDGRPVKLDGNSLHPINGGRLCPRGQAALQSLYHPDRLTQPLRRVGPRGALDSFQPTSWEEALDEIAERLRLLRQVGRPESLALLRGHSRGIGIRLAQRFLSVFGSPNDISLDRGEEAASLALSYSQGIHAPPSYDLQSTDYVLSLGSALLEASNSPVHVMRAYGEFRQGRPGRRGKLVQIESRLSLTGSSADEWIAVRPGSEGVLALGLAHVLVSEGLYDRDFVSFRTHGFGPYRDRSGSSREGLRFFLEENYYLERVANQTGVPGSVILRLAREFAAARNRLAVGPRRGPLLPGRLFDHLAVQVLNALAGNLDAPGGVLVAEDTPIADLPALPADPIAQEGLARPRLDGVDSDIPLKSDPEGFAEALERGAAYPLEVLFVLAADPAFASFSPTLFAEVLQKVPLIVSCTPLANDTSLLADFILPEAHFLETWELDTTPPGIPYPVVSLARPATETPRGEARPVSEILAALAKRVGGEVEKAFAWKDLTDLLRHEVEGLFEARRGTIMGTPFDEAWVRMMERATLSTITGIGGESSTRSPGSSSFEPIYWRKPRHREPPAWTGAPWSPGEELPKENPEGRSAS